MTRFDLQRLESHDCASSDNAAIRNQMKDKHPTPTNAVTWPELPAGWSQSINIDQSKVLWSECNDAEPDTGVGPRRANVHHIQVLADGVFVHPYAPKALTFSANLDLDIYSLECPRGSGTASVGAYLLH
jgi:hypothetical protein